MANPNQTLHRALTSRGNRRRAAQAIAAAAGSLLLLEAATHQVSPLAFAQDGDDDDSSGRGRGRGLGGILGARPDRAAKMPHGSGYAPQASKAAGSTETATSCWPRRRWPRH